MSSPFYSRTKLFIRTLFASLIIALTTHAAVAITVDSPDGNVHCTIIPDATQRLTFQINYQNMPVVLQSALGPNVGGQDLGLLASLGAPVTSVINETYPLNGGHSTAVNNARQSLIPVTGGSTPTAWTLEVRVFNDGVSYRYRVPGSGPRAVAGEASQWKLPTGGTIFYQDAGNSSYESTFATAALSSLATNSQIRTTATVQLPGPIYVMMTEANLINYSDLSLNYTGSNTFQAIFREDSSGWNAQDEVLSPWRVTLVAPDLNTLVNTDILTNLCPAPSPELATATWIQPGRSTWEWLVDGHPLYANQTGWVDRTAQLGFEYYLIDDGWKVWTAPGLDAWGCMKTVVDYAKTKNVAVWAWVHTNDVTTSAQRIAYFQKAKEVGLVGLKIDFMGAPNTTWVQWYNDTLQDAATYQLMVDFHGCVKPTGRERTWPQELTREAVNGRENGKRPSLHDTSLPFTRFVQGHADYTPTDFRGSKLGGNSYAHELAQAIVYTSPFFCYGGDPANYLQNPALDILKTLPATWDETRVLPGSAIGQVAGYARRKGSIWFVGIVNGSVAGSFTCSLNFLGTGSYAMDKLADSSTQNDAFVRTRVNVTSTSSFTVALRADGGFVGRIVPDSLLPPAPTGLNATGAAGRIQITWSPVTGATGYTLQRATAAGGPYTVVNLVSATTSFLDTNVAGNARYYYTVLTTNAYGSSDVSNEANALVPDSGLPSGWSDADIGSTGRAGYSAFYDGTYTVNGAGADLWSGNDQFHFLSRAWTGDGTLTARVLSLDTTDPWAKIGVMFRKTSATSSSYAFTLLTPGNGTAFQLRATTSLNTNITGRTAPYWLRLVRSGDTFTSFTSPDGQIWSALGTATSNPMAMNISAGLVVCSHVLGTLNTARFDQVSFLAAPGGVSVNAMSESQLRLSWTNASFGQTGFSIERSPADANSWTVLTNNLPSDATSYFDEGLTASTSYDYRLQTTAPGGAASTYTSLTATTPAGVGDGIPGAWRYQYFGNGLSASGQAAAGADPDSDGMTNQQEYLAGTIPTNGASVLRISNFQVGSSQMVVSFGTVLGKSYTLEQTIDLKSANWAPVKNAQNLPGTGQIIHLNLPTPPAPAFFRIQVQ